MKVCIAGALIVSALVGASSASANWTTNGSASGTAFSGTAGASLLNVATTGAALQGIRCNTSNNSGKLLGPSLASGNGIAGAITLDFASCTVVGQNAAVKCDTTATALNALAYSPVTELSSGQVTGIKCGITKAACGNSTSVTGGITVTGSVNGTYGNTTQQLSINTTGQSLSVAWTAAGCLSGTSPGSGTFTNSSGTALAYSTTSAFKPQATN
jgi:hypothetical protein